MAICLSPLPYLSLPWTDTNCISFPDVTNPGYNHDLVSSLFACKWFLSWFVSNHRYCVLLAMHYMPNLSIT